MKRWTLFATLGSIGLLGLIVGFQNCSRVRVDESGQVASATVPIPSAPVGTTQGACLVNTYQHCAAGPGAGERECDGTTGQWGSCIITSCQSEYLLNGTECTPKPCSPNDAPVDCTVPNGTGKKSCKSDGTGWGDCIPSSCASGFQPIGGICFFMGCEVNQKIDCAIYSAANVQIGIGRATCKADRTGYGPCELTTCVAGYHLAGTTCEPDLCQPNVPAPCTFANGTGEWVCNANGTGYGLCGLKSCNAGFHPSGGLCVANFRCVLPGDPKVYALGEKVIAYEGNNPGGCNPDPSVAPNPARSTSYCATGWPWQASCTRVTRTCTETRWDEVRVSNTRTVGSCGYISGDPICVEHVCGPGDFPY